MLKLIVHADDFGLTLPINEGIGQAHRDGILTSTSLMANGAEFAHAVALARALPTLDVGIHLTLVEERPLLPAGEVSSLVDDDGRFVRHATTFTRRYLRGAIDLRQVRRELDAQVRKVLDAQLPVSHLDSHQHVHMLPGVLRIVVDLAHTYGIPYVRFPNETFRPYMLSGGMRLAQLLALRFFCYLGRKAQVSRTDHFAGFFYGGRLDANHLAGVVARLPRRGTCELMCHPGRDDPASSYSHWQYQWLRELAALTNPDIITAIRKRGIQLTSYRALQPSGAQRLDVAREPIEQPLGH